MTGMAKPTADDMKVAMAIDEVCRSEFTGHMPADHLVTIRFAVMMRAGLHPLALLAAVEGSEHRDFQQDILVAGLMMQQPEQWPLFEYVEARAQRLIGLVGAKA